MARTGSARQALNPDFQERLRNRALLAGGDGQIGSFGRAIEAAMRCRLGGGA